MIRRVATVPRVLTAQGAYYVVTGVAPFGSRRLFEAVTGPKSEWWLVQTTGLLVTVVGTALLSAVRRGRTTPEIAWIAAGSAASLGVVDVVYVARGRIAPTYLLDALAQAALVAGMAVARREGAGTDQALQSRTTADPARGHV